MNLTCPDFILLSFRRLQTDQVEHQRFAMKNLEAAAHVAGMVRVIVFIMIGAVVKQGKKRCSWRRSIDN